MTHKPHKVDTFLICGLIFTITGTITLAITLWMAFNMPILKAHGQGDVEAMPWIFGLTGSIAFVLGVILLVLVVKKARLQRKLVASGQYIMAEVVGTPLDYNNRVNGYPTYFLQCSYKDPQTGNTYHFRSDNLCLPIPDFAPDTMVRVYVGDKTTYSPCYVDVASIKIL